MQTKLCNKCDQIKPISKFAKRKASNDGLQCYCKECKNEIRKQWYKNNIDYRRKYGQQYRKNNIEYIKQYRKQNYKDNTDYYKNYNYKLNFGNNRNKVLKRDNYKCIECGNSKDLLVHHRDGKGKGFKIKNNNLNNLITLCRGCHSILHNDIRWQQAKK